MAFIVDHGLRAESAIEAALTARRLAAHGIPCRVLTLSNLPRTARVQETARTARYAVLNAAAAEAGILHLLLGHHAADQAETVAMRAQRGPYGWEGMASWSARNDVVILRPLLSMQPGDLRAYLRLRGMEWIEDPSNQADKFERVRIRQSGAGLAPQGGAERAEKEEETAAFLARHAQIRPEGFAVLDAAEAPPAALGALIRTLGGALYPPRQENLAVLAARLRSATLGGVHICPGGRLGPGWLLAREPNACAEPVSAVPGALWDNRFLLATAPLPGQIFGALGKDSVNSRKYKMLPSVVLRTMPCLRGPDATICFPVAVRFVPFVPIAAHPFVI